MLLVIAIAKYTPSWSYASRMPHLEGEEVFGCHKRGAILPFGPKGDFHKHDHLTSFVHESTQLPLASTPKHMTMVLCPLLEPIVGFLFSRTMVGKSMKVHVDMECDVLIVPPNPTLNVVFCKRTLTMSIRHKSYH
jgi:hypothetical protein